jgi:MerR family redox-sensitive transcriptional activator SoxR
MARQLARLAIGQVSERTGLAISAIRFYETKGLVTPVRDAGGRRRYRPSDIRRLSFVLITQQLGFSLEEICLALRGLPDGRAPTKRDWTRISRGLRQALEDRINIMTRVRDRLDGCIGCGCLSLSKCALYNPDDRASRLGTGPRYLLGDSPEVRN